MDVELFYLPLPSGTVTVQAFTRWREESGLVWVGDHATRDAALVAAREAIAARWGRSESVDRVIDHPMSIVIS